MKTIKKWNKFKESKHEEDDVQDVQNVQNDSDEELVIKTNDEIKTEKDLKDFFNID